MASIAYIAASANRFSYAADASSESLIAFGSSKFVALWPFEHGQDHGVSQTLPGHEGIVTCVRFVSEDEFVSGDDKGVLLTWRRVGSEWKYTSKVQAHSKPISTIAVQHDMVISGASDSLVKIWELRRDGDQDLMEEAQSISLKGRYPLAVALATVPQSSALILAISGTDTNVQLWVRSENMFVHSATLAGHEDWVRTLGFHQSSGDQLLVLASGSQDATIRLWNIEPLIRNPPSSSTQATSNELSDEFLDAFEASLSEIGDGGEGGRQISLKRHILTIKSNTGGGQQFSVTFDALLVGHDAGVTSLSWRSHNGPNSMLTLLSTSTDSSVILWTPSSVLTNSQDSGTTIWINYQRFGDVGGQRLGGFVGGLWANHGGEALAWGWSGGWRRWQCSNTPSASGNEYWKEVGAITGHTGSIKGIDWSPNGEYLISTGLDQTTRIHGAIPGDSARPSWHELSRPQVHGYDLLNAVFIDALKFASIADEKVVRVFEASRGFVDTVEALGVAQFAEAEHDRPLAANVPPLGLSNKAIGEGTTQALAVGSADSTRRPFEGELASSTLWPEVEKVFGHGYELITLAVSNSRKFIATACRATNAEHAVVRIYDTQKYQPFGQPLQGHILTVTRIAFSPDDKLVLTVSRDRSWRLFALQDESGYTPIAADKSHGRIIWDCMWTAEGDIFATASRDKTVKLWRESGDVKTTWSAIDTIKTNSPATAVAFASMGGNQRRRLAVGLESGHILVYSAHVHSPSDSWRLDFTIDPRIAHVDHIYRLAWRPMNGGSTELASCSEDGTLRILIVHLTTD